MADRGQAGLDEAPLAFWRVQLLIGVVLYSLGSLGVLLYLLATPNGPHRGALTVINAASFVAAIIIFWWLGLRLVRTHWRLTFFCTWTVFTLAVISSAAHLDGGVQSPLTSLLVLPVLFAGLAYPPAAVAALTTLADSLFVALVATGPSRSDRRMPSSAWPSWPPVCWPSPVRPTGACRIAGWRS